MNNTLLAFYELLRTDFASFIAQVFLTVVGSQKFLPSWHIDVMADRMTDAKDGVIRRLIITLPPRSIKSISASVAWAAWILGHDPTARIFCASYSEDLAKKHARDFRKVLESDWYKRAFPRTRLSRQRKATHDLETTQGGGRFTTSVSGTATGRGGDYIIIDDPIKPNDAKYPVRRKFVNDWFDNTILSRLDNKNTGVIVIIMQRVHQDDLVGHVLETSDWDHLSLPAIAETRETFTLANERTVGREIGEALHPDRESLEVLKEIETSIGHFNFMAQYQQTPVPECGNLIRWQWFQFYEELPPLGGGMDRIVQSWDTALSISDTADWSVCTTWAIRGETFCLVDIFRKRLEFPSLLRAVADLKKRHDARDVLIEDVGAGKALIQQLRDQRLVRPIAIKPDGSKSDRMGAQTPVIEAGRVYLPMSSSWLDAFHSEVLAFPGGKHDDQVDSMSQFLAWAIRHQRPAVEMLHVHI
jgi:predicted phage terminase large subunit-like protein